MSNKKQVLQINTKGEVVALWPTARTIMHFTQSHFKVLNGKNKTGAGYKWAFYKPNDVVFPKVKSPNYVVYDVLDGSFVIRNCGSIIRYTPKEPIVLDLPTFEPFTPNERRPYLKRPIHLLKEPRKRKYLEKQRERARKRRQEKKMRELEIKVPATKEADIDQNWRPQMSLEFWASGRRADQTKSSKAIKPAINLPL